MFEDYVTGLLGASYTVECIKNLNILLYVLYELKNFMYKHLNNLKLQSLAARLLITLHQFVRAHR